jgi:phosphonate transport system substrate-binding protein
MIAFSPSGRRAAVSIPRAQLRLKALAALAVLALLLIALAALAPGRAAAAEPLNFGIISTESSQNLRVIWDPFLDDLRKGTGLDIKAFFATDYAGIIEGMRFGKVDLAWTGNKAGMEAVDRAEAEVFMQTVNYDGTEGYFSHIIANSSSPINSIEDMFAKASELSFGNGDPNSTSGFLVPGYYVFALNSKDPKRIFKRTLTSNHESNALSIANGQLDVATCNSEALERLKITFPDKRDLIKVIWTSPLIPSDPLVRRQQMDPAVKKRLDDFLLAYGQSDPREAEILKALQWKGFKRSNNDQLIPIRQLELFKEKRSLEDQAAEKGPLGEKDKARLAEVEASLAELAKSAK